MKAHIGADAASGLVHSVEGTAANESDISQTHKLLHGEEKIVHADAGYTGVEKRAEIIATHSSRLVISRVVEVSVLVISVMSRMVKSSGSTRSTSSQPIGVDTVAREVPRVGHARREHEPRRVDAARAGLAPQVGGSRLLAALLSLAAVASPRPPQGLALAGPAPNPSDREAGLRFSLARPGGVRLAVLVCEDLARLPGSPRLERFQLQLRWYMHAVAEAEGREVTGRLILADIETGATKIIEVAHEPEKTLPDLVRRTRLLLDEFLEERALADAKAAEAGTLVFPHESYRLGQSEMEDAAARARPPQPVGVGWPGTCPCAVSCWSLCEKSWYGR